MKKLISIITAITLVATLCCLFSVYAESDNDNLIVIDYERSWYQLKGDLNNDNDLSAEDALIALQLSIGIELERDIHMMSVLNEKPTVVMALKILQAVVGYHSEDYGEPITFPVFIDENYIVVNNYCACCNKFVENGYAIAFNNLYYNLNVICNDCYIHVHTLCY